MKSESHRSGRAGIGHDKPPYSAEIEVHMYNDIFYRDFGTARGEDFLKEAQINLLWAQWKKSQGIVQDATTRAPDIMGGLFQWILSGEENAIKSP